MTPRDDLRLDNLIADFALLKAGYAEDRAQRRQLLALFGLVARAAKLPLVVSRPRACEMLGISVKTARRDPARLPKPTAAGKYRLSDLMQKVGEREWARRETHDD
jgi:hypothetical protein